MKKYTDEDIRKTKKITCKIAGEYLGVSPMSISMGLQQEKLPIGYAIRNNGNSWSYHIIGERLIAYKNGKLNETVINGIEDNLNKIVNSFEDLKNDLMFLLKDKNK